jgi:hypothetical protein
VTTTTAPKPLPRVSYPSQTDPEARAAYAAGLRHLADVIETDPDCPFVSGPLSLFIHDDEHQAEIAARLRRELGGGLWKKAESGTHLTLDGMCAGLPIDLWLDRDAVCERVQVGEETVEHEATEEEIVPAAEAWTETVPVFEWRCSPLLGVTDDTAAQS